MKDLLMMKVGGKCRVGILLVEWVFFLGEN